MGTLARWATKAVGVGLAVMSAIASGAPPEARPTSAVLSDIPGFDFSSLPASAQKELANVLGDEFCYCGCPHTLGACLKQHGPMSGKKPCKHARRMALLAAAEAAEGTPAVEIILGLSRYYLSFREPRAALKPDARMCQGAKDAKVTLVEFSDFECPYCALARPMLEKVVKSRSDVRFCFMPYPLPAHPHAMPASQAVLFARDVGKFWPLHDALFENQATLSQASIRELGTKVGLNAQALGKALDQDKYAAEVNAFRQQGKAAGVEATPTIYVNGRKLTLPINPETLVHSIDDELEWIANGEAWAD